METQYVIRVEDSDGEDYCGIYCGEGVPELGADVEIELPDENGNSTKAYGRYVEMMEVLDESY